MRLDEAAYRQILGDITGLCDTKLDIGGGERNRDLVETYWRIGQSQEKAAFGA